MDMEGLSTWDTEPGQWYRYNGKERDTLSGWTEYGARWYDARIGRFTGVDPISDQFPHVSVFNYAENEPVSNIDLWGLQKVSIHFLGKGVNLPPGENGRNELLLAASLTLDLGNKNEASGGISYGGIPIGISGNSEDGYRPSFGGGVHTELPHNPLNPSFEGQVKEVFKQGNGIRIPNVFGFLSEVVKNVAKDLFASNTARDPQIDLVAGTIMSVSEEIKSGDIKVYMWWNGSKEQARREDGSIYEREFSWEIRLVPQNEVNIPIFDNGSSSISGKLLIDYVEEKKE